MFVFWFQEHQALTGFHSLHKWPNRRGVPLNRLCYKSMVAQVYPGSRDQIGLDKDYCFLQFKLRDSQPETCDSQVQNHTTFRRGLKVHPNSMIVSGPLTPTESIQLASKMLVLRQQETTKGMSR